MKTCIAPMICAVLMLTSCGTTARYASDGGGQKFQDGIYSTPAGFTSTAGRADDDNEVKSLVEETKASPVYLFGDRKDTIMIPNTMAARISLGGNSGTTVTVFENPYDWRNSSDIWGWYSPYTSGIGWGRPYGSWRYSWHMSIHSPWYYNPWYYDPWYGYSGWYDPWFHDPWCGWGYPWYGHHYCGWYGGFGHPHWGHHPHWDHHPGPGLKPGPGAGKKDTWYGPRHSSGSDRFQTTQGVSRGTGVASSGNSGSTSRETMSRTRTRVSRSESSSLRPASGRRSSTAAGNSTTTGDSRTSTYRKPKGTSQSGNTSSGSSYSGYRRGGSSDNTGTSGSSSSSSYRRSRSSSHDSGSSSGYSRSSSSSYSRGSSSGSSSSYSRGSSGGSGYSGGGYSRGRR